MALYKKDILVRPNSTANFETAMLASLNWLNTTFQDKPENKDANGNYIDYFFADVFFSYGHSTNSGQLWRIYTPACQSMYGLTPAATGRIEMKMIDSPSIESMLQNHDDRITSLELGSDSVQANII